MSVRKGFQTAIRVRRLASCVLVLSFAVATSYVSAAPKDGQKFKDWSARCEIPKGSEKEQCYIFQNLVTKKDEKFIQVLNVLVGYITTDGNPGLFATAPLGVSLPHGVQLRIDDGEAIRFGYRHCNSNGCLGALALTDELIEEMKSGKQAIITIHSGAQKPVSSAVSLQGFTAGFTALR